MICTRFYNCNTHIATSKIQTHKIISTDGVLAQILHDINLSHPWVTLLSSVGDVNVTRE